MTPAFPRPDVDLASVEVAPAASLAGRQAQRVLVLSTVAFTLLFAVWLMYGVLGIPIKAELHLTTVQFAWLTAAAVLSGSLLRMPFGILADRLGGRVVMTGLLLATTVPCALVASCHSFTQLLIAAIAFGISGNSFTVGIAWNSVWNSAERQGVALGVFGAGNVGASLTKLIGPGLIALVPVSGFLAGWIPGGWRFVPCLYTGLLLVMACVVWFGTPRDRVPGQGRSVVSMLRPLSQVRVWRFGLYYVIVFGAYVALSLWMPNYYHEVFHLKLSQAALLTALFIFPASLLRPFGGWLADRFGARLVTYCAFIGMLLVTIPMCLPPSLLHLDIAGFTVLLFLLGCGMGIGKASVYRYVPDYFPHDVGAVGGLVGSLGALGGFLLPLAFGYLHLLTGRPESCFLVLAVLTGASLAWLHLVVLGLRRQMLLPSSRLALAGAESGVA